MKTTLLCLAIAGIAAMASAGNPPTPGTGSFTIIENIEYATPNGKPLLMDLRVPDGNELHPVILYLHSGAWITGDRFGGPAVRQASRGYAVASIDYELAPASIWPSQIEDCKAAVRWLMRSGSR
jgi:acetyl esterase/lipase